MKVEVSSILGIIPSRYKSTRLEGKALKKIGDKTMIQHVYENTSTTLNNLLVATDHDAIFQEVKRFGGNVIMTNENHQTGTDRCLEAVEKWESIQNKSYSHVINVQGDEPFIHQNHLSQLIDCFDDEKTDIATLTMKLNQDTILEEGNVYVVMDHNQFALYFSRFPIPFNREIPKKEWSKKHQYYNHIGLYGFKKEILKECCHAIHSPLEHAEKLEQLRWLQAGLNIKVGITTTPSYGVDTMDDLIKVRELYKSK